MASDHIALESSALEFAFAIRTEYAAQDDRTWRVANRARVNLLLALATHAIDTCDGDLAVALLDAAWLAAGRIAAARAADRDPRTGGPDEGEMDLRGLVKNEAVRLLIKLHKEGTYRCARI
jgi:hypothetical protein